MAQRGPNEMKLLSHLAARVAIPPGTGAGSMAAGLLFLTDPVRFREGIAQARTQLDAILAAVQAAPDNPHGADHEAICGEILRRLDERGTGQHGEATE